MCDKLLAGKEKTYKFNSSGYTKMLKDIKQEKIDKISCVINIGVIIGMVGIGFLSKELGIVILANIGIGKFTSWIVG